MEYTVDFTITDSNCFADANASNISVTEHLNHTISVCDAFSNPYTNTIPNSKLFSFADANPKCVSDRLIFEHAFANSFEDYVAYTVDVVDSNDYSIFFPRIFCEPNNQPEPESHTKRISKSYKD